MIRKSYEEKLKILHDELIKMGSYCVDAIDFAVKSLTSKNEEYINKAKSADSVVDDLEKEIESLCVKLILREQPVAADLRNVIAAQKMIVDMERIGDQASDIADLSQYIGNSNLLDKSHIDEMGAETCKMLKDAVESYVKLDGERAKAVIKYDDVVDNLFTTVREKLAELIGNDKSTSSDALDLLLVAKYLERIGDHAQNIAETTLFVLGQE